MNHDLVMICAGRTRFAATRKKTPCHFHQLAGLLGQLHADGHGAIIKDLAAQVAAVVGMVGIPGGQAPLGIPQLLALPFYLGGGGSFGELK